MSFLEGICRQAIKDKSAQRKKNLASPKYHAVGVAVYPPLSNIPFCYGRTNQQAKSIAKKLNLFRSQIVELMCKQANANELMTSIDNPFFIGNRNA